MRYDRIVTTAHVLLLSLLMAATGCATSPRQKNVLAYPPELFSAEIIRRVPELSPALAGAPFLVDDETIARAKKRVFAAPRGAPRIRALVDFISDPEPEGLGLVYDWSASGNARATLDLGRGNCVALASVLVGLGRGLDWPIYYAEARPRRPETKEFEEVTAVSDHMAVLVAARTVQMIIDFTGLLDESYTVKPIDDLTAYAHIVNNVSAQAVMMNQSEARTGAWERALSGFELATRIQPDLGRGWNNMGIALSKLSRFDEAREAYRRAVELDTAFGSAERNLTTMETRALGETRVFATPTPAVH